MPASQQISFFVDLPRPAIIAHRGSSAYAPENTLAAFKLAVDQGADAIELDAKLTSDGQVVIMHDDTVDRTTNGRGQIKSLSLKQLKQLDAGSKFPPLHHPEKIPTLSEVLEAVGNEILINIELTNYSSPIDDLPAKVAALVKTHNLEERVMLSSFNIIALVKARNLLPNTQLGLLTFAGLARLTIKTKIFHFDPLFAINPAYKDVTSNLVATAHHGNFKVFTYTVNQADIMRKVIHAGVDGFFTDDPILGQKIRIESAVSNP
jgi:glycerophosphoryl diester phosphodiesterase